MSPSAAVRAAAAEFSSRGYVSRLPVLPPEEALALAGRYDAYAASLGGAVEGAHRFKSHLLLPWVLGVVTDPRLVEPVAAALRVPEGEPLLCWSTDFFCKEPGAGTFTGWHQDSTYVALSPPERVLTAWLALSPSTEESGCLRFLPGTGSSPQLPHDESHGGGGSMLLRGQHVPEPSLPGGAPGVPAELAPGEASLHSLRCVHSSGPNRSGQRRLGLAVRYMALGVEQGISPQDSVTVVPRGATGGDGAASVGYEVEPAPASEMDASAREAHARAVRAVGVPGPG